MGPRTYIRGKESDSSHLAWDSDRASMGPRTYIRGKNATTTVTFALTDGFNGAADLHPRKAAKIIVVCVGRRSGLQWGRGLTSAERKTAAINAFGISLWLQWGRGLTSAERSFVKRRLNSFVSFNGAADLHPRKGIVGGLMKRILTSFNGAADLHPRKAI